MKTSNSMLLTLCLILLTGKANRLIPKVVDGRFKYFLQCVEILLTRSNRKLSHYARQYKGCPRSAKIVATMRQEYAPHCITWEEHEVFNITNVNNICPQAIYVVQEIECIDEENESLGISSEWVDREVYSALCNISTGLLCRPYNHSHCPDFRIQYTCKCRNMSTTSLLSSTGRTSTVPLSTNTSGSNTATMAQSSDRQSGQTNDNHTGDDGLPLAGIIGIGVGGLLLLVVSCLVLLYCIKQKQTEKVHTVKELRI